MKTVWTVLLLCLAVALPLVPAGAQEKAAEAETQAAAEQPVADGLPPPPAGKAAPQGDLTGMITGLINKLIGMLAPIGAMFGQATGIRIGGSAGTGIAALIAAKVVENKAPSWIKWILYLTGGTMFAGGGANIMQLLMQYIPQ